MRLLLVEDEIFLANSIVKRFKNANIDVFTEYDGEKALQEILYNAYDVVVLDIMLPSLDGISILKEIREKDINIPVILTSAKGETSDKILGLDAGADDYLAKPYEFEELFARVKTCLRRSNANQSIIVTSKCGNLFYDRNSLTISTDTDSLHLTLKEFNLLEYLIQSQDNVISKDQIIEKIWGYDNDVLHNQVEVYISYLRKKLNLINANLQITTMRGLGYKLEVK